MNEFLANMLGLIVIPFIMYCLALIVYAFIQWDFSYSMLNVSSWDKGLRAVYGISVVYFLIKWFKGGND